MAVLCALAARSALSADLRRFGNEPIISPGIHTASGAETVQPFEIIDHTADVGLAAHGTTREEL